MDVRQFDFDLPPRLIAQRPAEPRDASRLLLVRNDRFEDRRTRELTRLLAPGDVLVVNDTRVIPAQLVGERRGVKVSCTLHRRTAPHTWLAFAKPAKRLRAGDQVDFGSDLSARVMHKLDAGEVELEFCLSGSALDRAVIRLGRMPLPPYIKRSEGADARDARDYQTIFASHDGAVAAPTAGLHFTSPLLEDIRAHGIGIATVTLHVGAGTFLPVKSDDVREHDMHSEQGTVSAAAVRTINAARAGGGRIVAVGTTCLRLLEAAYHPARGLQPFSGTTDLFILPGYRVRSVDLLLTNFHLPRSTLFMLVCAFGGTERMHRAYRHAIAGDYRFYSYGDCCLIYPERAP